MEIDDAKKLLFFKNKSFGRFLRKSQIQNKHLKDFIELVFSFIGFQKVDREIDTNELEIIKRLLQSDKKFEKVLLIHVEERNELFIYYMKKNENEIAEIKERLESNYFFTVEHQLLEHPPHQTQAISSYKRIILIQRLNHFISKKKIQGKIKLVEHDPSIVSLSEFDRHKFYNLKQIISKLCNENVYYLKVITDMQLHAAENFQSSFMEKFAENNWNIFVSAADLSLDESISKMTLSESIATKAQSESITSLDFVGNGSDIYHFFKAKKPKNMFLTKKFYLFFERKD